jgi:hypothetical protein
VILLQLFFWKSKQGSQDLMSLATAFASPDHHHDHRVVHVVYWVSGIEPMQLLESLWRPLRLKIGWSQKRQQCHEVTRRALAAAEEAPMD